MLHPLEDLQPNVYLPVEACGHQLRVPSNLQGPWHVAKVW
eukprot:Gb_01903 [translate_table: standard]